MVFATKRAGERLRERGMTMVLYEGPHGGVMVVPVVSAALGSLQALDGGIAGFLEGSFGPQAQPTNRQPIRVVTPQSFTANQDAGSERLTIEPLL
jgi:O-acetyl-ADP-ribose deacetylase (regulator of RNase III)